MDAEVVAEAHRPLPPGPHTRLHPVCICARGSACGLLGGNERTEAFRERHDVVELSSFDEKINAVYFRKYYFSAERQKKILSTTLWIVEAGERSDELTDP